jgi:hypothetical protein
MANMGDVEAVACANQMGSIDTTKGHKDMKEFDEGAIKNTPEVTYNSGSGKSNGQVRGHLARYWVENQPRGDMSTEYLKSLFQFMTKYPISKGYINQGPYHYGFCFEGNHPYLKLRDDLEKDVKNIVTSKEKCLSSPPKDILPPCNPGDKPEPLPEVPACQGAPEMKIE